jgi:hypothetical protein
MLPIPDEEATSQMPLRFRRTRGRDRRDRSVPRATINLDQDGLINAVALTVPSVEERAYERQAN